MLYDALTHRLQGRAPMHMPGHKRSAALAPYLPGLGAALDITEIAGFDNLHAPEGMLRDAMARAARLYGAHHTLFLVNGATAGILAGVRALTRPGDGLLMDRTSHMSVYHAAALCGLHPHYVQPALCPDTGIPLPLSPAQLKQALTKHPGVRLVVLTNPTYQGLLSDLPALVALAHAHGASVLVDAAHGAHLGLHPAWPEGAVASLADVVVHSVHKTLPSLTQTALLHARDGQAAEAAAEQLDIFQTSSPSYLLMASIDGCVDLLSQQGAQLLPAWLDMLAEARTRLQALQHLRVHVPGGVAADPAKLVISCAQAAIDGTQLMDTLAERFQVDLEMAQGRYALAMGGLGDTSALWQRLCDALLTLDGELKPASKDPIAPMPLPQQVMLPQQALSGHGQDVQLADAAGRICAEYVVGYPPGCPLLAPGELITRELAQHLLTVPQLLKTRTKGKPGVVRVLHTVDKL